MIQLYNNGLQFKKNDIFMSPPLSGRDIYSVTHDRNSEIKQLRPLFFRYALRYWLDIWYVGV